MTDHPAAPTGPVQPTPRPEGETVASSTLGTCTTCGKTLVQSIETISQLGETILAQADELARLRAEATAQTKQIEALTGRLAYCVDLAAHEQQLAERDAEAAALEAEKTMLVKVLGGTVEFLPTTKLNYLQRARNLVERERVLGEALHAADHHVASLEKQLAERDAEIATNEKKPTGEVDDDGSKTASALWECAGPDWHFRMVQRVAVLRTAKEALIDCDGAGRDELCDKCLGCVSATARKSASEAAAQTARVAELENRLIEENEDRRIAESEYADGNIYLEKQLAEVTRELDEAHVQRADRERDWKAASARADKAERERDEARASGYAAGIKAAITAGDEAWHEEVMRKGSAPLPASAIMDAMRSLSGPEGAVAPRDQK